MNIIILNHYKCKEAKKKNKDKHSSYGCNYEERQFKKKY